MSKALMFFIGALLSRTGTTWVIHVMYITIILGLVIALIVR